MSPATLNLTLRPGITFGPLIFTALDSARVALDLTGYTPFAEVRKSPSSAVELYLYPALLPTGDVGDVTANASTNLFSLTDHDLIAGARVRFTTTDTLPGGISVDTDYYVSAEGLTDDDFKVSSTVNGAIIDLTSAGTGTHTVLLTAGQILIPEITDETSHNWDNLNGSWDLILETPEGKRLGPFLAGRFNIQNGSTNPPE
jgi:hypothetical protein